MPITIIRTGNVFVQQPYYKPAYKIQITRNDGTVDTVADSTSPSTSSLVNCVVSLGLNEVAGNFNLLLDNYNGKWTNLWGGNERIDIWADFATATTKIFRGRVESIKYQLNIGGGHQILLQGRDGMGYLQDVTVVGRFLNADAGNVWSSIVTAAATAVTYTIVATGKTIDDISLRDSFAFNAISDVAKRASYDTYVDTDLALQTFQKNSSTNNIAQAVHKLNLMDLSMGSDARKVKNFIRVYGANIKSSTNVLIVKSAEDTASEASFGTKWSVINDTSLTTHSSAQARANAELAVKKDNSVLGTIIASGIPTLIPGQKFRVSSPYDNVNGFYRAAQVTHSLSARAGFTTNVTIEQLPGFSDQVISELAKANKGVANFQNNNNEIESFVISFDEAVPVVTLSGTVITNNALKIASGSEGTATSSPVFTARKDVSTAEVRVSGTAFGSSTFRVSNNAGGAFVTATANGSTVDFASAGTQIVIEIKLVSDSNNVDPTIQAVSVMLK